MTQLSDVIRLESGAPKAVWTTCPGRLWAETTPDAAAVVTPDRVWSYADLDRRIASIASRLVAEDVTVGTRVGLWMPRTPEAVAWLWALWRVGAVAAPLNRRVPTGHVPETLHRAGCTALVTTNDAVAGAVDDAQKSIRVMRSDASQDNALVQRDSGRESERNADPAVGRDADRDATLVFTSGSTGMPKAALHTWRNHVASADGSNANIPVSAGDRWLLSLPLYHVGGLAILFRCALAGAAVAIPGADDALADAVDALNATHLSLVSTQLQRLLRARPNPPSALKGVLCGGSAISAALLDDAHAGGWPVHTTYGCTEMASQVTTTPPGATRDDLRTSGTVLPHRELRVDTSGAEATSAPATGEIWVRGATLFRGYVDGASVHDPRDGGWYRTGDVGRIDDAGRLHVVGRVDRMFISGGENVQPEEIEAALQQLDGVVDAVVVDVPDATYGRRPVAFVRLRRANAESDGDPALPDALPVDRARALAAQLRATLPGYKVPDAFYALPDDATQGGLKTDRDVLARWARNLR